MTNKKVKIPMEIRKQRYIKYEHENLLLAPGFKRSTQISNEEASVTVCSYVSYTWALPKGPIENAHKNNVK